MPALVPPDSLSPGKVLVYYDGMLQQQRHVTGARLTAGTLPATKADALDIATRLAEAIAPVLRADAYKPYGWRVVNDTNQTVYEGSFATEIVGTHAEPLLNVPYLSQTIEFGGRGQPADITFIAGQARLTLFSAGTYTLGEGDKRILNSTDTALADFADFLATDGDIWADFYGQKCDARGYVNVQFNSRAQERYGS